ncbi:hypothetical protein HY933_04250 [Candidatus Falkowbacteria bacterium]|nr:hypothetical protein [Candidatus Falkowbacteria bacterium]
MPAIIIPNIYIFILAVVLAILEIQVEGPHGWAKNLPTWRPLSTKWYVRLYQRLMSGKEFTGYHLTMFIFVLLIFHLPYVFGLELTLTHWLQTMSLYFMFVVLWDFLWFVLNPYYPLKKFKREHIWWHQKWLWLAPVDYYAGLLISLAVLLPWSVSHADPGLLYWWAAQVGLFAVGVAVLVVFTLVVLRIDKWKK